MLLYYLSCILLHIVGENLHMGSRLQTCPADGTSGQDAHPMLQLLQAGDGMLRIYVYVPLSLSPALPLRPVL